MATSSESPSENARPVVRGLLSREDNGGSVRSTLNVMASLGAGSWSALIGLAVLPAYLRYLGAESFGLVGFLLTLQAWFLLLDLGLSPTASREMARFGGGQHSAQQIRDLFVSLEAVYLLIALCLGGALIIGAGWLATDWLQLRAIDAQEAARSLAWMALLVVAQWMATLYRSALIGLQLQVWLGGLTALAATLRALVTLAVLVWLSPTLIAFVLAQSACHAAEAAAMRFYIHRRLPAAPGRFNAAALKGVWRFAAGLTAITFLATLLNHVDKLLLARLLSLKDFGYFSLAVTVVGALSIAVPPVFNAAYPRLAELVAADRRTELADEYHWFCQLAAICLAPLAVTLALFSREAVYAWTGDPHVTAQVAPIVSAWVVGAALNGIMHVPYALQLAVGWVRLSVVLNVVAATTMVPAILLLVPRYGAVAAGWVWGGVNMFYFTVGSFILHRRYLQRELGRWYLHDVALPLAGALAPAVVCWWIASLMAPLDRLQSGMASAAALLGAFAAVLAVTPAGRRLVRSAARMVPLQTLLRQ